MSSQNVSFDPRIVLRPRSVDEIYDLALAYVRASPRDFFPLFGVLVAVSAAPIIALSIYFQLEPGLTTAMAMVAAPLIERVVTVYAGRHLFGNKTSRAAASLTALKHLPVGLMDALFCNMPLLLMAGSNFKNEGLLGLGGFLLMFWPFIVTFQTYLAEVSLLEQLSVGRAMKRARGLVSFRYGRVVGLLTVGVIVRCLFALGGYLGGLFVLGTMFQFEGLGERIGPWSALIAFLSAAPYMAVVRLFDYVDARTRREGWDIQVRFNAIAHRAQEDAAKRIAA